MNPHIKRQTDFNLSSSRAWDVFASHRSQVTSHLKTDVDPSRLCILGAGNCNDLDLAHLIQVNQEVHLVDIDAQALVQGIARQNLTHHDRIHLHGGLDLTGMLDSIATWSPETVISETDLIALVDAPLHTLKSIPGPFDLIASTCVLSQLIKTVVDAVGEQHPQFLELMQAIRMGHLRLLLQLAVSGGFSVLITDLVSSDSYPALASVPSQDLSPLLSQLVQQGNFFHGVNPAVIVNLLCQDPTLSQQVSTLEPMAPWLWNLGARHYAVVALKLQKR